jgi:hypothetical protein
MRALEADRTEQANPHNTVFISTAKFRHHTDECAPQLHTTNIRLHLLVALGIEHV